MKTLKNIHQLFSLLGLGFFFTICSVGVSQTNLVPNPSFEDTVSCPSGLGDFSVAEWYSPTFGSPDLFHPCNMNGVGVPQNGFGWQNARTGNAYVGFHTSDFSGTNVREYIQCKLINSLEVGKYYEISFWISRTDSSTKACNNIGIYLSSNAVTSQNVTNLQVTPNFVVDSIITEYINWVQVKDTIVAIDNEEYLTIGVFSDDASTLWSNVSGGWNDIAHYYIDDISVIEVNSNSILNISDNDQIYIYPSPADNFITVQNNEFIYDIYLYDIFGKVVINETLMNSYTKIQTTDIKSGIYFLCIKTSYATFVKKIIIYH